MSPDELKRVIELVEGEGRGAVSRFADRLGRHRSTIGHYLKNEVPIPATVEKLVRTIERVHLESRWAPP